MDDLALKALLEENHRLLKDNNEMLRSMRRYARIGFAFRIILWAIILGLPVLLWKLYFPENGTEGVLDFFTDFETFQNLIRSYEGLPVQ